MSSAGFTPQSTDKELEKLREAWRSLNDVSRDLTSAEVALNNRDHNLIAAQLQVAKWNVQQVKKAITAVGPRKTKRLTVKPTLLIYS